MGCSKIGSKREVHSDTGLSQKNKKIIYHLKELEKRRAKTRSRMEIIIMWENKLIRDQKQ